MMANLHCRSPIKTSIRRIAFTSVQFQSRSPKLRPQRSPFCGLSDNRPSKLSVDPTFRESLPRLSFITSSTTTSLRFPRRLHIKLTARYLSSTAQNDDEGIVLYRRKAGNGLALTGLAASTVHTAYWYWYVTDFIPIVNASNITQLHIDPMMGLAGLALAVSISAVFCLFPYRLVSQLTLLPDNTLLLHAHRLPVLRPSWRPKQLELGKDLQIDPTSTDAKMILDDYKSGQNEENGCGGNLQLYRGRLKISQKWPPYFLDIQRDDEVLDPDRLLQVLLFPQEVMRSKDYRPTLATKSKRGRRKY